MSPRNAVTKGEIVEAAWELVKAKGGAGLTARNLAARMGTSTMPIYSTIGDMDSLARALRARIGAALQEYQRRSWSPNSLLDAAVGYVMFACEEPALFLYLFTPRKAASAEAGLGEVRDDLGSDQLLSSLPDMAATLASMERDTRNAFVFQTWVYVHGTAVLVAGGLLKLEGSALIAHLEAAGAAFFSHHSGKGREGS